MISPELQKEIIKEVGSQHLIKMAAFAKKRKIKRSNGEFYSKHTFHKVLNNDLNLPEIEDVILDCAADYKKKRLAREERKRKFLESAAK